MANLTFSHNLKCEFGDGGNEFHLIGQHKRKRPQAMAMETSPLKIACRDRMPAAENISNGLFTNCGIPVYPIPEIVSNNMKEKRVTLKRKQNDDNENGVVASSSLLRKPTPSQEIIALKAVLAMKEKELKQLRADHATTGEQNSLLKRAVNILEGRLRQSTTENTQYREQIQLASQFFARMQEENAILRARLEEKECRGPDTSHFIVPKPPPDVF
jgi:hypothetical protein